MTAEPSLRPSARRASVPCHELVVTGNRDIDPEKRPLGSPLDSDEVQIGAEENSTQWSGFLARSVSTCRDLSEPAVLCARQDSNLRPAD